MQPVIVRGQRIQSVQRAAAILRAFGEGASELGVGELSRRLALHKSTVSRLLSTLEGEGLVERVLPGDKYRLGFEFARLAGQVPHFGDVRAVAQPFLRELADASHETVHLAVRDGDEVMNVEQISGAHLVRDTNWVGRRTPFYCVANGKALLAYFSEAEIKRLTAHLQRFTPRTITDKDLLRAELKRVQRVGYAEARGEIEEGLNAVAAPIFERDGQVVAALSVSGPAYRLMPSQLRAMGELVKVYAGQVSQHLGWSARTETHAELTSNSAYPLSPQNAISKRKITTRLSRPDKQRQAVRSTTRPARSESAQDGAG